MKAFEADAGAATSPLTPRARAIAEKTDYQAGAKARGSGGHGSSLGLYLCRLPAWPCEGWEVNAALLHFSQ